MLAAVVPFTRAISGAEGPPLNRAAFLFFAAVTAAGLMRLLILVAQAACTKQVALDFTRKSYEATLRRSYLAHVQSNTNDLAVTLTLRLDAVLDGIVFPVVGALGQAIVGLAIILALLVVSPRGTLLLLVVLGGAYLLFMRLSRSLIAREASRYSGSLNRLARTLSETLFGIRDVILDDSHAAWVDAYQRAQEGAREAKRRMSVGMSAPRIAVEWIGYGLIVLIACLLVRSGRAADAIASLAVIALGAQRLLPIAQGIFGACNSYRATLPHLVELLPLLEAALPPNPEPLRGEIRLERAIEVRRLGYAYPGSSRPVLHGIDLTIAAGTVVGIVGETGCGKSSLLDLITGLLSPAEGEIRLDDRCLTPENAAGWQRRLAHVPQSVHLADATIAQNIALAAPGAPIDAARLEKAARLAQLEPFVADLPEGFDTPVGERGLLLSGGQRQRIGVARALYRGGDLLVLDEATNALDEATETAVLEAIRASDPHRTIVMVTHRQSALRHCQSVYRLRGTGIDGPWPGPEAAGRLRELIDRP
jgi:ATP-binding cassette subfamily B protein